MQCDAPKPRKAYGASKLRWSLQRSTVARWAPLLLAAHERPEGWDAVLREAAAYGETLLAEYAVFRGARNFSAAVRAAALTNNAATLEMLLTCSPTLGDTALSAAFKIDKSLDGSTRFTMVNYDALRVVAEHDRIYIDRAVRARDAAQASQRGLRDTALGDAHEFALACAPSGAAWFERLFIAAARGMSPMTAEICRARVMRREALHLNCIVPLDQCLATSKCGSPAWRRAWAAAAPAMATQADASRACAHALFVFAAFCGGNAEIMNIALRDAVALSEQQLADFALYGAAMGGDESALWTALRLGAADFALALDIAIYEGRATLAHVLRRFA